MSGWPRSSCTASFPSTGWSSPRCDIPSEGRSTEFIPSPASIENYQAVFSAQNNFGRSLVNSVIVAGTTTILTLLFGIVGAYALARLRFRGKGAVLWIIMACSMFPLVVLLPPLLKLFSSTAAVHLVPVLDQHLPVRHHPRVELRPPACGVESDSLLQAAPGRVGAGGNGRWLHARGGLPQGDPAAGSSGRLHDGDHRVHRRLERILASPDLPAGCEYADGHRGDQQVHRYVPASIRRTAPSWRPVWS